MIYALDRQPLPIFHFGWRTHRRVHFALDAQHPVGASHHQKIVVVDDAVAFVGGLDLTKGR
jgi:phosphatidylserine/phosphatidylglycerophosphate/cardiolipin synthase-like enzyme